MYMQIFVYIYRYVRQEHGRFSAFAKGRYAQKAKTCGVANGGGGYRELASPDAGTQGNHLESVEPETITYETHTNTLINMYAKAGHNLRTDKIRIKTQCIHKQRQPLTQIESC